MLVSIVVITYNFEQIIVKCLESIKKQTYKKIELIISDDNSKDKTVEICKNWLKENKDFFIETQIISSSKNEGVVKNINKGLEKVKGEYIKIVAGDDILKEDGIENFINYTKKNPEAEIIFSKVERFKEVNEKIKKIDILPDETDEKFFDFQPKKQLKILLEGNFLMAPGIFFKKSLFEKYGYFDERFKMVEDYPYWIKLLKENVKFYYMPKITVYYRQSETSVSANLKRSCNKNMFEFKEQFYNLIYKKEVKNPLKRWDKYLIIYIEKRIIKNGNIETSSLRFLKKIFRSKNIKRFVILIFIFLILNYLNII